MSLTILHRRRLQQISESVIPNTFIGGVASTIPDAQTLATKLNTATYPVTVSDITLFNVVGSDIECSVNVDYLLKNQVFFQNTNIIYYKDDGGKVVSIQTSAFYLATNLTEINFPNCLNIGANSLRDTNCDVYDFPEVTQIIGDGCFAGVSPSLINIPKCTQIGGVVATDYVFLGITGNGEIRCHSSLATINNGGEEADIAYARSRGCTITYV